MICLVFSQVFHDDSRRFYLLPFEILSDKKRDLTITQALREVNFRKEGLFGIRIIANFLKKCNYRMQKDSEPAVLHKIKKKLSKTAAYIKKNTTLYNSI